MEMLSSVPHSHPLLNNLLTKGGAMEADAECSVGTTRHVLTLSASDEKTFPEIDYTKLISGKKDDPDLANSLGDENAELRAMAKKFEDKYGDKKPSGKKKSKKVIADEFSDIGYGYDESDTFIDNSEAYDELVPSDWTTEHGGFYINQGTLDFRPVSSEIFKDSPIKKKKKKKVQDEKLLKTPKELSTQKKKKQLLTKEKQRKRQESLIKAQKILVKKKKKPTPVASSDKTPQKLNASFEDDVPLAAIAKESQHTPIEDDVPLSKIISSQQSVTTPKSEPETQQKAVTQSSVSAFNMPNSTPGTTTSIIIKTTPASTEGGKPAVVKVESPLPPGLAEDIMKDIVQLKVFAESCVKGKFFTPEVNSVLLEFARKCRQFSPKVRNAVYDHMLFYLPCAKDTLVKRCRALVVQHQRKLEDEPMRLLGEAITNLMPEQKSLYDDEVAKALQEQAREQIKQTGVDPKTVEDENNSTTEDKSKKNFPKRKFLWSDEIRKLLCDVVQVRVALYKMSKTKNMTGEEYVKDFLETDIRKLWPKGWMTSRILYKESRAAHLEITQPAPKGKKKKEVDASSNDTPNTSSTNTPTSSKSNEVTPKQPAKGTPLNTPLSSKNISTPLSNKNTPTLNTPSSNKGTPTLNTPSSNKGTPTSTTPSSSKTMQPNSSNNKATSALGTPSSAKGSPKLTTMLISKCAATLAGNIHPTANNMVISTPSINNTTPSFTLDPKKLNSTNFFASLTKSTTTTTKTLSGNSVLDKRQITSPSSSFQQTSTNVVVGKIIVSGGKKFLVASTETPTFVSPVISQQISSTGTTSKDSSKSISHPMMKLVNSSKKVLSASSIKHPTVIMSNSQTTVMKNNAKLFTCSASNIGKARVNLIKTTAAQNSVISNLQRGKTTTVTPVTMSSKASPNFTVITTKVATNDATVRGKEVTRSSLLANNTPVRTNEVPRPTLLTSDTSSSLSKTPNHNQVQSSPKVSPFAITPTFVRITKLTTSHSVTPPTSTSTQQSKQVKRKSDLDIDGGVSNKRLVHTVYAGRTPLNTSIQMKEKTWSEVENDLVQKLSHEMSTHVYSSSASKMPPQQQQQQQQGISALSHSWTPPNRVDSNHRVSPQHVSLHSGNRQSPSTPYPNYSSLTSPTEKSPLKSQTSPLQHHSFSLSHRNHPQQQQQSMLQHTTRHSLTHHVQPVSQQTNVQPQKSHNPSYQQTSSLHHNNNASTCAVPKFTTRQGYTDSSPHANQFSPEQQRQVRQHKVQQESLVLTHPTVKLMNEIHKSKNLNTLSHVPRVNVGTGLQQQQQQQQRKQQLHHLEEEQQQQQQQQRLTHNQMVELYQQERSLKDEAEYLAQFSNIPSRFQ